MKMTLKKQDKHHFSQMLCDLKDFLEEDVNIEDTEWLDNFNTILDFQDCDGSFKFSDSYDITSDEKKELLYMETYLCTAILMKTYLTDESFFNLKEKSALLNSLKLLCTQEYGGLKGQIDALGIFMKAGLNEFIDLYSDFCPEFREMIEGIKSKFRDLEVNEKFTGPWGESFEKEIKAVNEYFSKRRLFVYGTLMRGEFNHHYLSNSHYVDSATIKGYDMYSLGSFPAITMGDNLIIGELYEVSQEDMQLIDELEGEGHFYYKKCETVTVRDGKTSFAFVYVFCDDCSDYKKIPSWKGKYV